MGIFDKLFGKKETTSETKTSKSKLRVNSNDLEKIKGVNHYKSKPFTGIYYLNYPNGKLLFETEQVNGKDHGKSKRYKGDGSLHSSVNFSNGKLHEEDRDKENQFIEYMRSEMTSQLENKEGLIKEYHIESGRIFSEGNYVDNKKQGVFKYYFDDDSGNLHSEITFKDDVENGLQKYYWENGKIRREGNVIDGKEDGIWKIYDENGELKGSTDGENFKIKYKDNHENGKIRYEGDLNKKGEKIGLHKEWFKNGRLNFEQNYQNGKLNGLYKSWYENGQIKYEGNFKDGEKDGLIHEWYENGQLQYKMNYKNGKYDGKLEKWYENGQLLYEQIWENGQLVKVTHYKENGEIISK